MWCWCWWWWRSSTLLFLSCLFSPFALLGSSGEISVLLPLLLLLSCFSTGSRRRSCPSTGRSSWRHLLHHVLSCPPREAKHESLSHPATAHRNVSRKTNQSAAKGNFRRVPVSLYHNAAHYTRIMWKPRTEKKTEKDRHSTQRHVRNNFTR